MKTHSKNLALVVLVLALTASAQAQVNSGSTGADGAFNPTANTVINMADHPDGIYHYTSVNIPAGASVTFIPNANNTPVVWLVQSNCVIDGTVSLNGEPANATVGGNGGPGGYRGGSSGSNPTGGQGPGGGPPGVSGYAPNASFGGYGTTNGDLITGPIYGNSFLLPLVGGSGGGGSRYYDGLGGGGGGGGGGAILIAASGQIQLNGMLRALGGNGTYIYNGGIAGGCGSGGAIRLVASSLTGGGSIVTSGGITGSQGQSVGGSGRVRFDTYQNTFGGPINGVFTQGFQPILLPIAGQGSQLNITSVGGVAVSASPTGGLATPDAIIAGQQSNPVTIVVRCTNLPLNTPVTVTVRPASGAPISAVGLNNSGTLASSTATVQLNMPRGGGQIYATAATAP